LRADLDAKIAAAHDRSVALERQLEESQSKSELRIGELERSVEVAREEDARMRAAERAEAERQRALALEQLAASLGSQAEERLDAEVRAVRAALEEAALEQRAKDDARVRELAEALALAERARDGERAEREAATSQLAASNAALEALAASRGEQIERTVVELELARTEVPALEAEIVVLRTELMSVRRQLDQRILAARATEAQLTRDRALLSRAAETLNELKARFEAPEGAEPDDKS